MADTELSEHEKLFIDALFEHRGSPMKAAASLGHPSTYGYYLSKKLRQHIIERAEYILALHAPRAVFQLTEGVDEDIPAPTNPLRVQCAKEILDRAGIVKKDKVEVSGAENIPLFILPAKKED